MKEIERVVVVEAKVDDLWGLYAELRRADFAVRNVGKDYRGTLVYLNPSEDKDPAPIVESWIGQPVPKKTPILRDQRIKELRKIEAQEQERAKLRVAADGAKNGSDEDLLNGKKTLADINTPMSAPKVSLLKQFIRRFI